MIWMMWWKGLYGLVRSADNNSDVCGESSQWFAATHSVTPFGLTSRAAITGVVYSISLRPEALRNGYDSLSQPAVTALPSGSRLALAKSPLINCGLLDATA